MKTDSLKCALILALNMASGGTQLLFNLWWFADLNMAHLATVRAQLIKATVLSLKGSSAAGTFPKILRAGESTNLFSDVFRMNCPTYPQKPCTALHSSMACSILSIAPRWWQLGVLNVPILLRERVVGNTWWAIFQLVSPCLLKVSIGSSTGWRRGLALVEERLSIHLLLG